MKIIRDKCIKTVKKQKYTKLNKYQMKKKQNSENRLKEAKTKNPKDKKI